MNIKSLLLGSAAALAVVTGAQAADAVVAAEPEPMDYVRVCDAYGTGYFYIPGTETCLQIGGRFRYEKHIDDTSASKPNHYIVSKGRVKVTAKNDSEWGTVSSWITIEGTAVDNVSPRMGVSYVFGIGGLAFGYYDSQWAQILDYAGRTDWGGDYLTGPKYSRQFVSYAAAFDSITATIALENDHNTNYSDAINFDAARSPLDGKGNKYMPDVIAGLSGKMGDYGAIAAMAYDESDDSFAVAKKVTADIGNFGLTVVGLYSNSAANSYFSYDGFSVIGGVSANVTDSVKLATDLQYWDNSDYRIIGDVNWKVASGFRVLLEGSYGSFDQGKGVKDLKQSTGMLRFQREF